MVQLNGTRTSAAVDSAFGRLVEELTTQLQAGEAVDWPSVAQEHPDYADELAAVRPALEMLGNLSRAGDAELSGVALGAAHEVSGEPLPGILGDFRLLREVGRGGMGVVYEAEQISLGRRVALKVLPYAGALDAKQLQRFKNEAKAAASLKHEHIVQVHAIGCERGVHFYAMEFIDGQTLAQVISAGSPDHPASRERARPEDGTADYPPVAHAPGSPTRETSPVAALTTQRAGPNKREFHRRAAELIADAADALEHAHALGIVHRDVKPGNLLLDADGKVYVSDFGLARFGPDAGLTMSGDLLGTLRYMAPEQALARHGLADHRVDVYGLGCTLYELLTGKPAVDGEDKADIVRRIAFEDPIALRKLEKVIPAELETIALKCLAKEPKDRFATAAELAADLRRFLEDRPIKAKPPTMRQRTTKWARRHAGAVWPVAAGLLVVSIAAVVTTTVVARQKHQTDVAYGAVREAYRAAREALDELSSQVIDDWLAQQHALTPEHRAFLQRALAKYEEFAIMAGDDEPTRAGAAAAFLRVGDIRARLGQTADAEGAYACASELYQKLAEGFPATPGYLAGLASGHRGRGMSLRRLGRSADADAAFQKALAVQEQLVNNAPGDAGNQYELAGTLLEYGVTCADHSQFRKASRPAEAEHAYRRGLDVLVESATNRTAPSAHRHRLARLYIRLGSLLYWSYHRYADAEKEHRRGIDLLKEIVKATGDGPNRVQCREDLGDGLAALGLDLGKNRLPWPEEAITAGRDALAIREQLAAEFPAVPEYRFLSAENLCLLGNVTGDDQFLDAEKHYRQAVALFQGLVHDFPDETAYRESLVETVAFLGDRYHRVGRYGDAAQAYTTALPALERQVSDFPAVPKHRLGLASFLDCVAAELADLGETSKAEQFRGRAFSVRQRLPAALRRGGLDSNASQLDYAQLDYGWWNTLPFEGLELRGRLAHIVPPIDEAERPRLRRQTLSWLTADLATWTKFADTSTERPRVRQAIQRWLSDSDLAGVRGDAIAKLPEAERPGWQKLWADVATLLRTVSDTEPNQPPAAKP